MIDKHSQHEERRERDEVEWQMAVSIFHEEGAFPCSGDLYPQPVMNGCPGQGSRKGRVPEQSLFHVRNVVWVGRVEGDRELGKNVMESLKRETTPSGK